MTRRRALGLFVLAAWVIVLGVHVRREYFRGEGVLLAEGARLLAPGAHFYLVRLDGNVIGIASSRLDTIDGGFRFNDELTLDVPALGRVHRTAVRSNLELDARLALRRFRFDLTSDIGRFDVRGAVSGDTLLELELESGGEPQRSTMAVDRNFLLSAMVPLRLAAAGALQTGREYTWSVFDPAAMGSRDVRLRTTARDAIIVSDSARLDARGEWQVTVLDTVPVWRLEQSFGGVTIVAWVDDDGQIVREESPLGYTIERTYYEIARQEWQRSRHGAQLAAGYGAVIEGTAIASNVDLSDVQERPQLAVRLGGVALTGFDLEGGRQRLRGDTLVVTRETVQAAGYSLPYTGAAEVAAELEATPLIQARDGRIIAAARRAVGDTRDPREAARRLNDWVYRALDKDITLSVPSALQVLESGQGDCNEHTVLYVALARAVGLPARTAVGLVHIRGRFYYHAWPEVWLGEWTAVDPTLGQFPADASHLRFLVGGLARQTELIRLIGRLQLEVV
ncbi:MAG TPA: transglutaminase-like domain-containing protein [Longimicrobiales bacterium]|nr:transglutaminase-like domain-containing protein [Longimicrobiales bacterium]